MREFKFRQWNSFSNNFHYFSWKDGLVEGMFSASLKENPVMQWTGLTDKNGKDVYEGDLLTGQDLILWCDNCKQFQVHLPYIGGECLGCSGDIPWFDVVDCMNHYEVIGNMYENPELLDE